MNQLCQNCHAQVDPAAKLSACPACGVALIAQPGPNLDPPGAPAATVDHRGIILPRRHPVGGVITPR